MTTPERGSLDPTALALPPLPRFEKDFHRMRESIDGSWCHFRAAEARERILLARIAELEAALSDCINLAEWWINHKREPGMCERDYRTWLALGHHSEGLLRAKAAIDAAREAKP